MSEDSDKPRTGWRLTGEIAAVTMIILTLIGIGKPAIIVSKKKSDRAEAVSNAKQLGLALYTFREDYGTYPSVESAIEVRNNTGTTAKLGNANSNDFFRQLLASGTIDQEKPFFARTPHCRKPDNVMSGDKLLEKGEVGFAYLISHSGGKDGVCPIALTPLLKGKLLFDFQCAKGYFNGSAMILSTDGSVAIHPVDRNGRVMIHGKDFFDPSQPYWHGIPPKVAWPE